MKKLLLLVISVLAVGCNNSTNIYRDAPDFDWMPHPLQWERNIRDCRSQPQCNAADLFNRTS